MYPRERLINILGNPLFKFLLNKPKHIYLCMSFCQVIISYQITEKYKKLQNRRNMFKSELTLLLFF